MATYNLVNSVKGGCGKTTFSIWLSYYLNNMEDSKEEAEKKNKNEEGEEEKQEEKPDKNSEIVEKEDEKKAKKKEEHTALLIDMDLLGTSMQFTFDGNSSRSLAKPEKSFEEFAYTNDIFKGVKTSQKKFIRTIKWNNGKAINAIFASMETGERDKFKSGRHSGYAPTVRHSIFRAGLKELIKNSEYVGDKEVKHFIFDMPPNSDGFSDAAMECIFSKKYADIKEEDRKNLFIMVGSDLGQTIATINELDTLLKRKDEKVADRIFVVFNHNVRGILTDEGYALRAELFRNALTNGTMSQEDLNRIYFLIMCEGDKYAELGIDDKKEGKGLRNIDSILLKDLFPEPVISAYAKFQDDKFTDVYEKGVSDKLLKLVLGED